MKPPTWPDGVPFLSGQRMREHTRCVGESELCELWWTAGYSGYVKWDDHMYGTIGFDELAERFERVGSTAVNARSDAVRQIMGNMGWSAAYFSIWWGLEPMWRAAMGDAAADELRVRRAHPTPAEPR